MPVLIYLREPETNHLECERVSCGVLVARYYPYISSGKMLTPEKVSRLADISVLTPWGRARRVNNVDVATKSSDTRGWSVRVHSPISRKCCQTLLFHSRGDDSLYRIDKIYSEILSIALSKDIAYKQSRILIYFINICDYPVHS